MAEWTTEQLHKFVPFVGFLGARLVDDSPERIVFAGSWSSEMTTTGGALNGGYLLGLIDNAGGMCAFRNLPEGATGTSTIESKTNFMRAVKSGDVAVTAVPLHVGRTTIVLQIDVTDDEDRLVSRTLQTQVVVT